MGGKPPEQSTTGGNKKIKIPESSASQLMALRKLLEATRSRMFAEITALARRGYLNLAVGGLTTFSAIALLAFFVLAAKVDYSSPASVLFYYLPRLSSVVFVEVFSFFFLRLYRASLDGIKYFQNELTNVELRFISIEIALLGTPSAALASLVSDLAKTERNFILKAGEATVELRKAELETRSDHQALNAVNDLVKSMQFKR